jgi:hypothetical protein
MDELLKKFLKSTLNTAVQAGITTLVTDVDFKDAFKGQAALNVAGSILGGGSPFDLFKNKAAQPAAQPKRLKDQRKLLPRPQHLFQTF